MQCSRFGFTASSLSPGSVHSVAMLTRRLLRQVRFCQTATEDPPPVIRVPHFLRKRVEHVKQTRSTIKVNTTKPGKVLIQSKHPEKNQFASYTLGKFEEVVLCSQGWKHKKSFGDFFSINKTKDEAPFVPDPDQNLTFESLNICQELVEVLEKIAITQPTTVQLKTIPRVLRGHNILSAAETGSGKTLSYLLPIVHKLQASREEDHGRTLKTVVLVPSRELAQQVASVSRTLCAPFGFKTSIIGGGRGVGSILNVFKKSTPDILVATPGALVKTLRRKSKTLSDLKFLVLDEADTMFDPSFSDLLEDILQHTDISTGPKDLEDLCTKAQLLVVGATFPSGVGDVLSKVTDLGSMVVIKSRMLHFLMQHVKQTFMKVRGEEKVLELNQALKALQENKKEEVPVLVFCNKSSTVNWLGYMLEELGVTHVRLQGEMPATLRSGIFQSFQKGLVKVLVCTDIASRGLDTSQVSLVVNYDFPNSHTDYIHRAGRVGRAGGVKDVEVLSFVTHPWEVELLQKMELAARRRSVLPGMETRIREPKPKEDMDPSDNEL